MSYTSVSITNDDARWESTVSADILVESLAQHRESLLKELQRDVEIKGFRKGNAPLDRVAGLYDPQILARMVAERAVREELPVILASQQVPIVEAPRVTIDAVEENKPIHFSATAGRAPKIELSDYKTLKDRFPSESVPEVSDQEHTEAMTHIRRERARIDAIESGTAAADAAEKAKELAEGDLPAIDDTFAQQIGYADAAAFSDALRKNIKHEKDMQAHQKRRAAILDTLVKEATVQYPASLKEYELEEMEAQFSHDLSRAGMTLDSYLESAKQTKEQLRASWDGGADNRAKVRLILADVARRESIDPPAEMIEHELVHAREQYKNADPEALKSHILHALRNEMTIRFLEGDTEPVGY